MKEGIILMAPLLSTYLGTILPSGVMTVVARRGSALVGIDHGVERLAAGDAVDAVADLLDDAS